MANLNEHVLEVRYKPNPKILDYRGSWAEAISNHMDLPEWRVLDNRIDIYSDTSKDHAFVGFRNAGFVAVDTPTKNYFPDKAVKLFRYLFTLSGFDKAPYVERIGVKSKFCKQHDASFDDLKEKFISNYLSLTDQAKKVLNAKLVDIGAPINFADQYGNFNTMCGPMTSEQIALYFDREEGLPDVGLYYEIDYWLMPKQLVEDQEIIKHANQFAIRAWERFESISKLILGG